MQVWNDKNNAKMLIFC